jgi:hypothetical protein
VVLGHLCRGHVPSGSENFAVFDFALTDEELAAIDALDSTVTAPEVPDWKIERHRWSVEIGHWVTRFEGGASGASPRWAVPVMSGRRLELRTVRGW